MLMNSYIAAAVLAFCASQTGAAPVAVPPPELLAEVSASSDKYLEINLS